jgi:GNAT superfamily N-acetyltransferase
VAIRPFRERACDARALAALDRIFFEASATKAFANAAARGAFRERWLGRFLVHWPEAAFLAIDGAGEVLGYVVGALGDPARDLRFADIAYFADLSDLTTRYPAHLHINLAAEARNRGIGGRLITAFCDHARAAGAPGVHLVTSAASRNRSFYAREGFVLLRTLGEPGREIVMLGRALH